jgi:hypothetical protein
MGKPALILMGTNLLLIGGSLGFDGSCANGQPTEQHHVMKQIYAGTEWYRVRQEPEKSLRGVLAKRDVPVGPATRMGLLYILVTSDRLVPVYAANAEHLLAPYVGRPVVVYGKLVDLTNEGYGLELWIGSIEFSRE